jgi:hypothetical protein
MYKNDPRELTAKFAGKCAETGAPIKKGELCIYYPSSREIFHPNSKTAAEYYSWKADINQGFNY